MKTNVRKLVEVEFPGLPPTLNHLYRNNRYTGVRYKTSEGRRWQSDVAALIAHAKRNREPYEGYVALYVELHSTDYVRWDVDNRVKALQDCLSMGGVLKDDKQVIELHAQRIFGEVEKTRVTVTVITADLMGNPSVKAVKRDTAHGNTLAKKQGRSRVNSEEESNVQFSRSGEMQICR